MKLLLIGVLLLSSPAIAVDCASLLTESDLATACGKGIQGKKHFSELGKGDSTCVRSFGEMGKQLIFRLASYERAIQADGYFNAAASKGAPLSDLAERAKIAKRDNLLGKQVTIVAQRKNSIVELRSIAGKKKTAPCTEAQLQTLVKTVISRLK